MADRIDKDIAGFTLLSWKKERAFMLYLLIMNIIAFILFGLDKKKAQTGGWRFSEFNLFLAAILGGSLGAWLAMYTFRHKTRHMKFVIVIPLIILVQFALYYVFIFRNPY